MSDDELTLIEDIPVYGDLAGESEADNVRHMVVRVAFINEFRQDERVEALCHAWGVDCGLEPIAVELAETLDSLAQVEGLESRGELFDDSRTLGRPADCEELVARASQLYDELKARLGAIDWDVVAPDAIEFVKSLGLPWPWLAMEVLETFILGLCGFTTSRTYVKTVWVDPVDPPAPATEFQYSTRQGEKVRDAVARLVEGADGVIARLCEPVAAFPRGRVPADLEAEDKHGVGRYGRWFYRRRIRGESISAIARDANCDRSTVRYGLREAERLLKLTPYTF